MNEEQLEAARQALREERDRQWRSLKRRAILVLRIVTFLSGLATIIKFLGGLGLL